MGAMPISDGQLTLVHPEHIRTWWPRVKPIIERLFSKIDSCAGSEDVYAALVSNRATLHIASLNGMIEGFTILEPIYATYGHTLNIWIAAGFDGKSANLEAYLPVYKNLAHLMKARRITFSSSRPGWAKEALKIGFKPKTTTYAMEI